MLRIILDTNFLIYCVENKIDYREEIERIVNEGYELAVPGQVVTELNELYKKAPKFSDRNAAWLALKLLDANKVNIVQAKGKYADDAILDLVRMGSIVATLDLKLRKKLRGTRIIIIEGKRKLAWA